MMDPLLEDPHPEPCDACPLALLDEHLASWAGRVIAQTIDLDFALQAGVTVKLEEIPYPEFLLLRFLNEERLRYHKEESQKDSERRG